MPQSQTIQPYVMKQPYAQVIGQLNVQNVLAVFEPTVIGTPPLGIDIESSDIDIACTAKNLRRFVKHATNAFSEQIDFCTEYFQTRDKPAARCNFLFGGWEIEIFCQNVPINEQWGVRHFRIEKRLLDLKPELVSRVTQLKRNGMKTEAAFAKILNLPGDPFEAVLKLESKTDADLYDLLS